MKNTVPVVVASGPCEATLLRSKDTLKLDYSQDTDLNRLTTLARTLQVPRAEQHCGRRRPAGDHSVRGGTPVGARPAFGARVFQAMGRRD
jgi:hypothetical protein